MIRFEEALDIVIGAARRLPAERVGLVESLGRILAEDVFSDMDMPPFDKSAVDGYACKREDIGRKLKIKEVIPAGKVPRYSIESGECSKLMTGGMVPQGADTVIMVEDSTVSDQDSVFFTVENPASNICYRAEDLEKGSKVLDRGTRIRAQEIAVLASVGQAHPLVYSPAKIGIITTGDELVEPQQTPGLSQIRNSNAWQLIAQATRAGCITHYYGIATDDESKTMELIEMASAANDIVVLTGGVSTGDFDLVPDVLTRAGFTIHFRKLAVQPGKPSIFASRNDTYVFALPGNPVSSFVQFELMVRKLIDAMSGCFDSEKIMQLPMGFDYYRKRTDRKAFIPVVIQKNGTVGPVEYHGSAHIHSYITAEALISVEIGVNELKKGSLVNVRFL